MEGPAGSTVTKSNNASHAHLIMDFSPHSTSGSDSENDNLSWNAKVCASLDGNISIDS